MPTSPCVHDNWLEQANTAATNNHGAWMSDTQTGGTISFTNDTVEVPSLTGDSAVTRWMEAGHGGTGTANISNNAITGRRRAINIDGSPSVQVRNNILVPADQGWGYVIANADVPAGNIDGNVVWAPNGSTANASNATLTEAQWKALGYDTNGLAANPAFTNPAAGDYSVGASSPALGHGAASLAAPVPTSAPAPVSVPVSVPVQPAPATPDTIDLHASEDAWQGRAQFTVVIDGVMAGGVNTATASHAAGLSQDVSLAGNWGGGPHTIGISFIDDAWGGTPATDRNLHVKGIDVNGASVPGATATLLSTGTAHFAIVVAAS